MMIIPVVRFTEIFWVFWYHICCKFFKMNFSQRSLSAMKFCSCEFPYCIQCWWSNNSPSIKIVGFELISGHLDSSIDYLLMFVNPFIERWEFTCMHLIRSKDAQQLQLHLVLLNSQFGIRCGINQLSTLCHGILACEVVPVHRIHIDIKTGWYMTFLL